jgi:hypothetical protein
MSKRLYTAEDVARFRAQYAVAPAEAAALGGIHRSTFYRHHMPLVYAGRIQSIKVGSCRRIIVTSYLRFLEQEANDGK